MKNMRFIIRIVVILFLQSITSLAIGQEVMDLYDGIIPNSKVTDNLETNLNGVARMVSRPTLTMYVPSKANGTSVIICPGGGYGVLVMDREGERIAKEFNKIGITAFVLKYRLPSEKWMIETAIGPLQDAQRAIIMVRENAKKWNIDPYKIGIMGFSAGGHLAATAGTHFDKSLVESKLGTSPRPDFMLLVYPVISLMNDIGHLGTRNNLLAGKDSEKLKREFSNEFWVNKNTPPTFITHAADDKVVPVEHSLRFYRQLLDQGVSVEMHLYAKGGHGYLKEPSLEEWFGRCQQWLVRIVERP